MLGWTIGWMVAGAFGVGATGGVAVVDSVPDSSVPAWSGIGVTGEGVTEGAWASGGGGVLQLLTVGVESELSGSLSGRLEVLGKWGHEGVAFPSVQGLSSLDADDFAGLGEAWVEWRGWERVRVKAGRVDANTEFAASEAAGSFANPSFGLSPVLCHMPSYPEPASSVNLFVGPGRDGAGGPGLGAGVYRSGDEWVGVAEVSGAVPRLRAIRWSAGWAGPLGAGREADGGHGVYLIVERPAEGSVSPFVVVSRSWGAGPDHVAGGLVFPGWGGSVPGEVGVGASALLEEEVGNEAVAEAFVAIRPVPWIRVQWDGQLRLADGRRRAFAGLIRVAVEY